MLDQGLDADDDGLLALSLTTRPVMTRLLLFFSVVSAMALCPLRSFITVRIRATVRRTS
jgi:hypothetical protein